MSWRVQPGHDGTRRNHLPAACAHVLVLSRSGVLRSAQGGNTRRLAGEIRKAAAADHSRRSGHCRKGQQDSSAQRAAEEKRLAGFWELPQPAELNGLHSVVTLGSFRHTITHHHYTLSVLSGAVSHIPRGFRWWRLDRMQDIPLSTIARKAIRLLNPRTI